MRAFAKIGLAMAIAVTVLHCQGSSADLILYSVRSNEHCPAGLTVKSKAGPDGMIQFEVAVDAEKVAQAGESYQGRVGTHAVLQIGSPQQRMASVTVLGMTEDNLTRYRFRLSPTAAKTSELQLAVSLYEKSGHPTFGGGVTLQIHLAGFDPTAKPGSPNIKQ